MPTTFMKKVICLMLSVLMCVTLFVGCGGNQDETQPTTVDLNSIDYERNDDITDEITVQYDYMTSTSSWDTSLEVARFCDHPRLQVDGWSSITMGISTMGEITLIVDEANKRHNIENNLPEDAEPLYTYKVRRGSNTDGKKEAYQPTLLIDPSNYDAIYLFVYKDEIPYVVFTFARVSGLYNLKITQESDWIVNAVKAASVSSYKDEDGKKMDFVDVDGRNKYAKQNMVMSGNITFDGDGFTWDSLKIFCEALGLKNKAAVHGYKRTSDDNFTYYTIVLCANPSEVNPNCFEVQSNMTVPCVTLVATFDPLTQQCVGWKMDMTSKSYNIDASVHDVEEKVQINVHELTIDETNYDAMEETVNMWIDSNAIETTTKYIVRGESGIVGYLTSGFTTIEKEIEVDGTMYYCVGSEQDKNGNTLYKYLTQKERDSLNSMSEAAANEYIKTHARKWLIRCGVIDANGNVLGTFVDGDKTLSGYGTYYVAKYSRTVDGVYEDLRVLERETVNQLLTLYTKTYRLSTEEYNDLVSVFNTSGLLGVKAHVDTIVEERLAALDDIIE